MFVFPPDLACMRILGGRSSMFHVMEHIPDTAGGRKRKNVASDDPTCTPQRKKSKHAQACVEVCALLPTELWWYVVRCAPDAKTLRALAQVCRTFGDAARAMQKEMQTRFARFHEDLCIAEDRSAPEIRRTFFALPNGRYHGIFTEWYSREHKKLCITFANGVRNGPFHHWHTNGHEKETGMYKIGRKDGMWITWHSIFHPGAKGSYRDGKKEGSWTRWHSGDVPRKMSQGSYHNGEKTGPWTTWHMNDEQIDSEGSYHHGEKTGLWTTWTWDGQIESKGSYHHGEKTGLWTTWTRDGQIGSKGSYHHGKRTGLWTTWQLGGFYRIPNALQILSYYLEGREVSSVIAEENS